MISRSAWAGWFALAVLGGCITVASCDGSSETTPNGEGGSGGAGDPGSTGSTGGAGGTGGKGGGGAGGNGGAGGQGGLGGSGGLGGNGGGGGDGGAGGSGGEGGVGVGGSGGEGGSGGAGGQGGAGGAGPACYDMSPGCAEYITSGPAEPWCDALDPDPTPGTNPSYVLFKNLEICVCGDPTNPGVGGTCKVACMNETCAGMNVIAGGMCQQCIVDTANGCGIEFNECANDV